MSLQLKQAVLAGSSHSAGVNRMLLVLPGGGPWMRRPSVLSVALHFAGRSWQRSRLRLVDEWSCVWP